MDRVDSEAEDENLDNTKHLAQEKVKLVTPDKLHAAFKKKYAALKGDLLVKNSTRIGSTSVHGNVFLQENHLLTLEALIFFLTQPLMSQPYLGAPDHQRVGRCWSAVGFCARALCMCGNVAVASVLCVEVCMGVPMATIGVRSCGV